MNGMTCPGYIQDYPFITMAHGGGGRLTNDLLSKLIRPLLDREGNGLGEHDGAVLSPGTARLAFTTDSYVVTPLFFPGGDIGKLAVYGTVNDLAMCGAVPRWISLGLVIEEGFSMTDLERVVSSVASAAETAGVRVVTGDTKVVDRGKADGIYINTSGIGVIDTGTPAISPDSIRPGDSVIISGDIGRHGIAVMAAREELRFSTEIRSDLAPLAIPVEAMISSGIPVKCMRDLTRGGLASALNEIASVSGCSIEIQERSVPVCEEVHSACEMLGFDPLYVANEGRMAVVVPGSYTAETLDVLRSFGVSSGSVQVGKVIPEGDWKVSIVTGMGTTRVLSMLSGEQLPRIC